jgi:hypothetical protein
VKLVETSESHLVVQWEKYLNEATYEVFYSFNGTWNIVNTTQRSFEVSCLFKEIVAVYYQLDFNESFIVASPIRSFLCAPSGDIQISNKQNLQNYSIFWTSTVRSLFSCFLWSEDGSSSVQLQNFPFSFQETSLQAEPGKYKIGCEDLNSFVNKTFEIDQYSLVNFSSFYLTYPEKSSTLNLFQVTLHVAESDSFIYSIFEVRDVCSISTGYECVRVPTTSSDYNQDLLTSFQYFNMSGKGNLTYDFYPPLIGKYSLSVIVLQSGVLGYYWDNIWFDGSYEIKTHKNLNLTWTNQAITNYANEFISIKFFTFLVPKFSENYTISVKADDNIRVYVNGNLLIDTWTTCCEESSGLIYLEKEKYYYFKLEYRQIFSDASLVMFWSSASQSKEVVPEQAFWMPQRIQSPWVQSVTLGKSRWDLCYFSVDSKVKAGYQNVMSFYSVDYNGKLIDNPSDSFAVYFSEEYQLVSSYVGNGMSRVNFTLKEKGVQRFDVKLYDFHVKGSPFEIQVLAGDMSYQFSYCDVELLGDIVVGQFFNFTVYPLDAFNNSLDDFEGLSVKIYLVTPIISALPVSQPSGWLEKYNKTISRAFPRFILKVLLPVYTKLFYQFQTSWFQAIPKKSS